MPTRALASGVVAFLATILFVACSSPPPANPSATAERPLASATPAPEPGCSTIVAAPTPGDWSGLPSVTAVDYSRGPASASATLLLYCDFQSAECELFNRVLDQLEKTHRQDLRVVFRPFPIPVSVVASLDKSELAASAALAAADQGRFWEMRDLLHARYLEWSTLSPGAFGKWIGLQAAGLALDKSRFESDFSSQATKARAQALYDAAMRIGISAVPTVFINGGLQSRAALSYAGLDSSVSLIALGARQYKSCPPFNVDSSRRYLATIHTKKGDIFLVLFSDKAPLAVNSFVFLARHGWFDGTSFHRVIPGFIAQAGDPSGTGLGGPGYIFKSEIRDDLRFDRAGVVGMANSGPDTNGSQFFITYAAAPQLDGNHTVFGQVLEGMQVVGSLVARDAQATSDPAPGDELLSVTIEER